MSYLTKQRVSRRQAIKAGALAGLGLALLPSACSTGQQPARSSAGTTTIKRGGIINIGSTTTFPTHPYDSFRQVYHTEGGRNFGKYSNKKLDAMVDELGGTLDKTKAKKLVLDIQKILEDEYPEIPVVIAMASLSCSRGSRTLSRV